MQSLADAPAAYCRLFGTFSLEDARGAPVRIRSRRARALLAHLIVVGAAGASRERLSGLLWSDRAEEQARASLRQCLLELRRELTEAGVDALDVGREQVVRRREGLEADLDQLEDAIRQQDGAALSAALEEIGASLLLEGLSIGGLYDEWLARTRAQVDNHIEQGVRRLIDVAEEQGAWDDLRRIAAAYLLRSPADEAVAAAAIRADMALGVTSAAHRRFRALERTLVSEYGVRPGDSVSRALRGDREASPPQAHVAPAPRPTAVPPEHSRPIVVVGAFEGGVLDEAALALGQTVRDEVVAGLSRFRDLSVVTDQNPSTSLDPSAFADPTFVFALGARFRRSGRPGLTVQLLRLRTQSIVWSDTFDIPEDGILSATDLIVGRVVGAVLPSIDQDLARPYRDADSDRAYLRYLYANRRAFTATTHDDARLAATELHDLIAAHPNFVLPYCSLAYLYNTDFNYTRIGSSDASQALDLAKRTMSIDRAHVHGYTVAGWSYLRLHRWEAASELFEQALSLNPFNASRLKEIGFGLLFLDRVEEARELLTRGLLINPVPEDFYFSDLGLLELTCGNLDRAATYFELVANPNVWTTIYQAVNAELSGRPSPTASRRAYDRIESMWPHDRAMTEDAIIEWMLLHKPYRSKKVEERFVDGVRKMLSSAFDRTKPEPLARQ
jgi:DNA-binding SARP family transcriptional activator/TolB-like protein